jgi:hypothetical protein
MHLKMKFGLGGNIKLTAIIEREGSGYVSLCPELDIASQGELVDRVRFR